MQDFPPDADAEQTYYAYSATLRIHGDCLPLDQITKHLGIQPTHQHRKGDPPKPGGRGASSDAWHLTAAVPEEVELTEHLRELWRTIKPGIEYLRSLDAKVDVFCGYRSNDGIVGFEVAPDALEIFRALNVPFGVSVIIESWLEERLGTPTLQ
ncbi:MAG: DUF4279 domain-containing protein [Sphingomonas sp.]|uniref:DUF4279 domain-containing protein n=1 Tax=Sphingomonas sp. TaxID=28214 RepID=UPI001B2F4D0A|nr:DUF4279 domain-containing protein [Sphingomonas sp.]MBO9622761.1 DUF4279 domain-containing protein [Sphingomonas sp.]